MKEYHKIQTVFKRDMNNKGKTLLDGQYSLLEFEYLAKNMWTYTEKVDGTNIRVIWENGTVRFGGKTDNAQIYAGLIDRLRERFPDDSAFQAAFPDLASGVCLYGEGYGAKIQKGGGKYRDDQDFVLFDVKVGDWWLQRKDVEDVATKLGLDVVPIIGEGTLLDCVECARTGFSSWWGDFQAEGIVARPKTELCTRAGHRIITKVKCRDFACEQEQGTMRPRPASETTRSEIRHCRHSVIEAADDLTPVYLCGKDWDGKSSTHRLQVCVLYTSLHCAERYED